MENSRLKATRRHPNTRKTRHRFPYLVSVVGMARRAIRAACSGAILWTRQDAFPALLPPATARAGTSQRDVPTPLYGYRFPNRLKSVGRCRRVKIKEQFISSILVLFLVN